MNFIKNLLLLSVILLSLTAKAQSDYFERKDGTIVKLYGEKASIIGDLIYTNEKGKELKEKTNNIKLIVMGGKVLINLPYIPKSKGDNLQKIIAYNDKYVVALEQYGRYINIFDREFNFVNQDKIKYLNPEEVYSEHIDQYFKECADFKDAWFKCIDNSKSPTREITYFNCNNALDLITNKPVSPTSIDNQTSIDKKEFYINVKGEETNIKGMLSYKIEESFKYRLTAFKFENIPSDEIKYIYLSNKVFAPFKLDKISTLMEVVAFSNNYVITTTYKHYAGQTNFSTIDEFHIYNRQSNALEDKIDKDGDLFSLVKKYFADSTEFIKIMEDNEKNHRKLFFGITYFNCNNAKELIEGIELN